MKNWTLFSQIEFPLKWSLMLNSFSFALSTHSCFKGLFSEDLVKDVALCLIIYFSHFKL